MVLISMLILHGLFRVFMRTTELNLISKLLWLLQLRLNDIKVFNLVSYRMFKKHA